jgi:hypothetical protein
MKNTISFGWIVVALAGIVALIIAPWVAVMVGMLLVLFLCFTFLT